MYNINDRWTINTETILLYNLEKKSKLKMNQDTFFMI